MSNNSNILLSQYQESSIRLRAAWADLKESEKPVRYEIGNMMKILEEAGYPRMDALKKIIADHKDLDGFSQATIYRQLPENMKHSQKRALQKLEQDDDDQYKDSGLSRDKWEHLNKTDTTDDPENIEEEQQEYQPSSALEEFRKQQGTVEEQEQQEQTTTIIDPTLLDQKISEIARLEQEIDDLKDLIQNFKKERVEANMSKSYTSEYDIEYSDTDLIAIRNNSGICPLSITSYPEKTQNVVRFDRSRLNTKKKK